MTILQAIRQMQVPVLALVLLGAGAAKLSRVLRARSVLVVLDAISLFPARLRRPATTAVCATELLLGVGLLATAGRMGHGGWADGVRLVSAFFFLVVMSAVMELRKFRPGIGCGCFGGLSTRPPGLRSILRPCVLAVAALVSVHSGALTLPPPGTRAALDLGVLVSEFLLVAALSPEAGEALARLGYTAPCELRLVPAQRAIASLRHSLTWRRYSDLITGAAPDDMWRELCWWYLVYPGRDGSQDCDVVFAVEVRPRRPAIHVAVVPRTDQPSAGHVAVVPRAASADGLSPVF